MGCRTRGALEHTQEMPLRHLDGGCNRFYRRANQQCRKHQLSGRFDSIKRPGRAAISGVAQRTAICILRGHEAADVFHVGKDPKANELSILSHGKPVA